MRLNIGDQFVEIVDENGRIEIYDAAIFTVPPLPASWSAKFLPHDCVIRYVAIQENKIGLSDSKSSVIFHTSIQFGDKYKTVDDELTKSILVEHARRLFPEFPDPIEIRHHKWNYSQILDPYDNTENNMRSVIIHENPLIIIAGDAFTSSNFEGCVASAGSVADILKNYLVNKND
ncbi:renalase [Sarracenia purpurea var. burkii]